MAKDTEDAGAVPHTSGVPENVNICEWMTNHDNSIQIWTSSFSLLGRKSFEPHGKKRMAWDEWTDGNRQGSSPSVQCTGEFRYPRDDTHSQIPRLQLQSLRQLTTFHLKLTICRVPHDALRDSSAETKTRLPLRLLSLVSAEEYLRLRLFVCMMKWQCWHYWMKKPGKYWRQYTWPNLT